MQDDSTSKTSQEKIAVQSTANRCYTPPYYEEPKLAIYCGDAGQVLAEMTETFDFIITDPPYGMGRVKNDDKDYLRVVGPILRRGWELLKENGSMFVFTSTGEVVNVANEVQQPLKRLLWMYKPNDCTFPLAGWLLKSEAILWFKKGNGVINLKERKPYKHDCYVHTGVGQEGVEGHPTVKPLNVVGDLVSRCPDGGAILDPFMGSGTTLVAGKKLGYRTVGIEIEKRYCDLAIKRLGQSCLDFIRV